MRSALSLVLEISRMFLVFWILPSESLFALNFSPSLSRSSSLSRSWLEWCEARFESAALKRTVESVAASLDRPGSSSRSRFADGLHMYSLVEAAQLKSLDCAALNLRLQETTALNLSQFGLFDLRPLSSLVWLKELNLSENHITDITALESLSVLSELQLRDNPLNELRALASMKDLEVLDLGSTLVDETALKTLREMPVLKNLYLSSTRIKSFSQVLGSPLAVNLVELDIENLGLKSLHGLETASSLKYLYAASNSIQSLLPLESSLALVHLDLRSNALNSSSNERILSRFQDIESLNLSYTGLKVAKFLINMTRLRELYLHGNMIQSLPEIASSASLRKVGLDSNQLAHLPEFDAKSQITELYVGKNQIENLNALQNLSQLKVLHVNENKISELKQLQNLSTLVFLEYVNAKGNLLEDNAICPLPIGVTCLLN